MKTCVSYDKCMNKEQHKGGGFFSLDKHSSLCVVEKSLKCKWECQTYLNTFSLFVG